MLTHLGAYLASNFLVAAPPPAKAAYLSTLYGLVLLSRSKQAKQAENPSNRFSRLFPCSASPYHGAHLRSSRAPRLERVAQAHARSGRWARLAYSSLIL